MGHHTVIMIFGVLSFLGWYGSAISTKREIKEVGFHKKYYPKKYIMPSRKFRKLFKLKKREIPKWLYLEFYVSFVYIALFVISTLLYLLLDNKPLIAQTFFWMYGILMCGDMSRIMFYLFLYRWNVR